ncbi:MAG: hypothetical protein ACRD4S_11030 [Candidatus Acidiferrales bacterium]
MELGTWVGRAIGKAYWVLFGWWYDAPRARRAEQQFAGEILEGLPFLFGQYRAEIIPNEGIRFPSPFGYAFVTVAVGHLLLRFVRGRGEFRVLVASRGKVRDWRDWKDIQVVQAVLDESDERSAHVWIRNVAGASRLLQGELPRLLAATSADNWDLVRRKANASFPPLVRIK